MLASLEAWIACSIDIWRLAASAGVTCLLTMRSNQSAIFLPIKNCWDPLDRLDTGKKTVSGTGAKKHNAWIPATHSTDFHEPEGLQKESCVGVCRAGHMLRSKLPAQIELFKQPQSVGHSNDSIPAMTWSAMLALHSCIHAFLMAIETIHLFVQYHAQHSSHGPFPSTNNNEAYSLCCRVYHLPHEGARTDRENNCH